MITRICNATGDTLLIPGRKDRKKVGSIIPKGEMNRR
jgi:hypothetical protein